MNKRLPMLSLVLISSQVLVCLAIAQTSSTKPALNFTHLIHVSVSDETNRRVINGLPQEAFTIFYGDEKPAVTFFGGQDAPASIGILVDASGSMKAHSEKLREFKAAVLNFIRQNNPANNYFVMSFQEKSQLLTDVTKNVESISNALSQAIAAPHGESRLYDAFYDALEKLRRSDQPNVKRVILLISDGVDKYSKHNFQELKKTLSQSDVLVYAYGTLDLSAFQIDRGHETLNEISRISGGKAYLPHPSVKVEEILQMIGSDLKHQYTLGFTPTITNSKFTKLKVTLSPEKAKDLLAKEPQLKELKLKARTREGYLGQ